MQRFFEKDKNGKEVNKLEKELCDLVAESRFVDAHEKAKSSIGSLEKRHDYPLLSGVYATEGYCSWQIGLTSGVEAKRSYYEAARSSLENALMIMLHPEAERAASISLVLEEVNVYLEEIEDKELKEKIIPPESLYAFHVIHKVTLGLEMHRTRYRLEKTPPDDSIERGKLHIKEGQNWLDLDFDSAEVSAKIACNCWKQVLRMEKSGEKLYPSMIFLAVVGILSNDPTITVSRAKRLRAKGIKSVSSPQEAKDLEEAYLIAIRRTPGAKRKDLEFIF